MEPLFVDLVAGNLRLQSNSPCINAGNNATIFGDRDLDGRPRIVGGSVDIGAYEFQTAISGAFIGWLQQFGLPTNGSVDFSDSDGDLMNNWQEWIAGTNPTNALSALRLLAPSVQGTKIIVSWQSVAGVTYSIERSSDLTGAFAPIADGIPGHAGTTSLTDSNGVGTGPLFYRVRVASP